MHARGGGMKILIAMASSSGQLSGVQRHAINLARCLLTRDEVAEVHLVAAPWQQEFVYDSTPRGDRRLRVQVAPIGNHTLSRNLWFYAQLPKLATRLEVNVVHLAYPVPVKVAGFHCPTVVSLHDLYPYDIPENFGFPKVMVNRAILGHCLRAVDAIACVSQSTFEGLKVREPRLTQKKARVIYNSVEPPIEPLVPVPEVQGVPFLLCVAQHRRNKNILLALRVFERLLRAGRLDPGTRLLIVGIPGPETRAIRDFLALTGLTKSVSLTNGILDAQLQWCYRNCRLLFAPSSIEGFGLPVAEALQAGCRVVCSDISAFRELKNGACCYVPLGPQEGERFAEAIQSVFHQAPPAPIVLPQLSGRVIADEYVRLYRSLLPAQVVSEETCRGPIISAGERQRL
jgi:glycosyltransferase involved in cell wall biosynthesis